MGGTLRNTKGCWTCRTRRKKCDATHPICRQCESLKLTCYGYDRKPSWKDGGTAELEMIQNFKSIVRHTSRQKGSKSQSVLIVSPPRAEPPSPTTQEEEASSLNTWSPGPAHPEATESTIPPVPPVPPNDLSPPNGFFPAFPTPSSHNAGLGNGPAVFPSHEILGHVNRPQVPESSLLMHYLDEVFPSQFPAYQPTVLTGGRGWLYSLLMKFEPLKHTAFSLAAYHRQAILMTLPPRPCPLINWHDLQIHHSLSLQELKGNIKSLDEWITSGNEEDKRGVLASMIQLIFAEMSVNGTDNWKLHLCAATSLVREIYTKRTPQSIYRYLRINTPPQDEQLALGFFCAVTIWLDIMSCISLGTSPRLQDLHSLILQSGPHAVELEYVMGCENRVMLSIAQIAALHEWKAKMVAAGTLDVMALARRAGNTEADLKKVIMENFDQLDNNASYIPKSITGHSFTPESTKCTTMIFALAALGYLNAIVSGPNSVITEVSCNVSQAVRLTKRITSPSILRSLTWPLLVTACLVDEKSDQDFFRDLFTSEVFTYYGFGLGNRIKTSIEEFWANKGPQASVSIWADSLKASGCSILLV